MKKEEIIERAMSGAPLAPIDVARVTRDGRCVVMRHAWRDGDDGRVLSAVSQGAEELARYQAPKTGTRIEVYSARGDMINEVCP